MSRAARNMPMSLAPCTSPKAPAHELTFLCGDEYRGPAQLAVADDDAVVELLRKIEQLEMGTDVGGFRSQDLHEGFRIQQQSNAGSCGGLVLSWRLQTMAARSARSRCSSGLLRDHAHGLRQANGIQCPGGRRHR